MIRSATLADQPGILELETHFPSDHLTARGLRRLLARPSARIWVAPGTGRPPRILASLVLLTRSTSGVARIYSLVVAPAARGRGLAAELVRRAERCARRAGKREVALEVRVDNASARALYARLGYVEAAALPGYYEDGADGLRLRKALR